MKTIDYLSLGNAYDLPEGGERNFYRALEIVPGAFTWGTFLGVIIFARVLPLAASIFMLAFSIYWLLKMVYLALHTRSAYAIMQKEQMKNWTEELERLPISSYRLPVSSWKDLWHIVILPTATEPYDVVYPALESIVKSNWDKRHMIVALSIEEKAGEDARNTARRLEEEFASKFSYFLMTFHPAGLPGEIPGKGANERWGGIKVKELVDGLHISYERILISSFDSDTVVHPGYIACLTYHYLTTEKPLRTSFQPVAIFTNNIWEAPAISRVMAFSSTFWHTMNQERPEKHITFSSHSMPFKALVELGFWQPNVVSEDSRIFWQAFFHYNGDYQVESMYYPVLMDANAAPTFWRTIKNLYKQQRRWAYGIADVPYVIFAYWKKRKVIPFGKFFQYAGPIVAGFYSWGTNSILLFVGGWLPIFLGGDVFNQTIFSYDLPRVMRVLMTLAMIGLVSSVYLSIRILPPRPPEYGKSKYVVMVAQWFLVLFTLIFLGAVPMIEAQTRLMLGKYLNFWVTEKYRKK